MTYQDHIKQVNGQDRGKIFLFALSTCGWCAKTKNLLNNLKVKYSYVDVDLLNEKDQKEVERELEKLETEFSFPKIIIKNNVLSGFDEGEIRNAIK